MLLVRLKGEKLKNMDAKELYEIKFKTKGIMHILTHERFWNYINNMQDDNIRYLAKVEELQEENIKLKQELEELKQDIEDNYKRIDVSDQVGISERDFY